MEFTFYDTVPGDLVERVKREHDRYEAAMGTPCGYNPFYLTAVENGALLGAISGYTAYAEVYLDDILVFSGHRGMGVGRGLLEAVYKRYEKSGLDNINLCTSRFQAPEFYEKCGFTLEFVRKNRREPKLDKFFYVRYFEDGE